MKILLDENLPHDLRHFLPGYDVFTVAYMGWSSVENGELLQKAGAEGFDVMITKDSGVQYEQHLSTLPVAVLILNAKTNKLEDIRPLLPATMMALANLQPKSIIQIG